MVSNKVITIISDIPCLLKELKRVLPDIDFCQNDKEKNDQLFKSEIIIADTNLILPYMQNLKNVKWIQMTWAGLDCLFENKQLIYDLPYLITRFSGKHFGRIMSEYVITSIVNHERNIFDVKCNQKKQLWNTNGKIQNYRIISDLTIGVLGMGQIGSFVAQSLKLFGAKTLCLGRTVKNSQSVPVYVDQYYTTENLSEILKNSDYIINTLPKTKETIGLLNGNILENCAERGTVFINVGRGSIIKEDDLLNALNRNWISAAILDVFESEPLSKDSLLWSMPQVVITPHVSAVSRAKDIAEQFAENYKHFCNREKLTTAVDFTRGY